MSISSDIIKKGRITIYSDTPEQIEKSVLEYNKLMDKCRFKKKHLQEIELGYTVFNPLIIGVITAVNADVIFERAALALIILLINAVTYIVFALFKKNYIVSTATVALLMLCSIVYVFVLIADIIITVMYTSIINQIKTQPGYPAFVDIAITYERYPTPKG